MDPFYIFIMFLGATSTGSDPPFWRPKLLPPLPEGLLYQPLSISDPDNFSGFADESTEKQIGSLLSLISSVTTLDVPHTLLISVRDAIPELEKGGHDPSIVGHRLAETRTVCEFIFRVTDAIDVIMQRSDRVDRPYPSSVYHGGTGFRLCTRGQESVADMG
jgi:hypothetical protein